MTLRRLALALLVITLTALVAFAVVRAMPGDPAEAALFQQGMTPTPEALAAFRAEQGLDQPFAVQFVRWLVRLLCGDWGLSARNGEAVLPGLIARLPVSLTIGAGGLALGATAAYGLALAAAAGLPMADGFSRALALITQALPAFVLGLLILYLFGVELRWLRPFTGGPVERIVLPTLVVALYTTGRLSRFVVARLRAAMESPWFITAKAKGCTHFAAVRSHAGGFGLIALVAALRPEAAWMIGGTAVAEVLFGAPGVSAWVVESVSSRDYVVLQGYILTVSLMMMLVHALASLALRRLDPRLAV